MSFPVWKGTFINNGVTTVQIHTEKDAVRNFFWIETQKNDLPVEFHMEQVQVEEVPPNGLVSVRDTPAPE